MWLFPVFRWFQANPLAQWIAGIGAALAAFWAWISLRDRRIRREARKEAKREVVEEIQEQTDETLQRIEDDRAAVRDLNEQQLRQLAEDSPNNRGRLHRPEAD